MTPLRQRHCLDLLRVRCQLLGMFDVAAFVRGYIDAGDTIANAHEDLIGLYNDGVIELRPGDPLHELDAPLLLDGPQGSKLVFARLIEREIDAEFDVAPNTKPSRSDENGELD